MNIYNRCFDDQGQMRIRLETVAIESLFNLIEEGKFTSLWSFILDYENSLNPFEDRRKVVESMSLICVESVIPSDTLLAMSKKIIEKANTPPRDALHLASAEAGNCKYFITCDDRLIRMIKAKSGETGIKVKPINPVEFVRKEGVKHAES